MEVIAERLGWCSPSESLARPTVQRSGDGKTFVIERLREALISSYDAVVITDANASTDAEILNRALGLAQTQGAPSELVLLHVVDTAMTRVLGPETADRETGADERYLSDLVSALRDRGYAARAVLLHGPDPAGELVAHLRKDPVDLLARRPAA